MGRAGRRVKKYHYLALNDKESITHVAGDTEGNFRMDNDVHPVKGGEEGYILKPKQGCLYRVSKSEGFHPSEEYSRMCKGDVDSFPEFDDLKDGETVTLVFDGAEAEQSKYTLFERSNGERGLIPQTFSLEAIEDCEYTILDDKNCRLEYEEKKEKRDAIGVYKGYWAGLGVCVLLLIAFAIIVSLRLKDKIDRMGLENVIQDIMFNKAETIFSVLFLGCVVAGTAACAEGMRYARSHLLDMGLEDDANKVDEEGGKAIGGVVGGTLGIVLGILALKFAYIGS